MTEAAADTPIAETLRTDDLHLGDIAFQIIGLSVNLSERGRTLPLVQNVSFCVRRGQTLGIVGESGCGKSITVMSAIGLIPSTRISVDSGVVRLGNQEITRLSPSALRHIWGSRVGVVFQDPMTSLNPSFTIGYQMREALRLHVDWPEARVEEQVRRMLERVGISAADTRLLQYPHELSGGLRQRVLIAMALICRPEVLIADEPTTALDVTLQAQILALIRELRDELGMAVVLITHDLGVVAEHCDHVAVMYAGRIVESAPVGELFLHARHPYTCGLLQSIPTLSSRRGFPLPVIEGTVPAPGHRNSGCPFADRCNRTQDICRTNAPALVGDENHSYACWNPEGNMA